MARHSADTDLLEAIIAGRLHAADVPHGVRRLAELASAVRDHTILETASDEFRERLRTDLLTMPRTPGLADRVRDRLDTATAGMRHSLRLASASAVASMLIGTTGVAAASQAALPGDVLYSVKQLTESARLAFASGDVEQGRLHLAFARARLDEIEAGIHRLTSDQLSETLAGLDAHAAAGADQLLAAVVDEPEAPFLSELSGFTQEVRARLLEIADQLPLAARPAAERTLEVLRRIDVQAGGLTELVRCEACAEPDDLLSASLLPRVVLPGDGPAAPVPCRCVGAVLPPPPSGRQTDPDPTAPPPSADTAEPSPRPSDDPPDGPGSLTDQLGDLVEPVDDVGSLVDDLLGDTPLQQPVEDLDELGGEIVDDLGTLVDDLGDTVGDGLDGTGGTVDELLGDPSGNESGLLDGLPGLLGRGDRDPAA